MQWWLSEFCISPMACSYPMPTAPPPPSASAATSVATGRVSLRPQKYSHIRTLRAWYHSGSNTYSARMRCVRSVSDKRTSPPAVRMNVREASRSMNRSL